jgi:1,5-anhydro-D-fructose reductase (1,5-anhydro-D-mannitol-forming)
MVRFGIFGFGLHAEKRLVPGFAEAKHARLIALSRRDPEQAKASARKHGITHAFSSGEELCRCPEVDAVLIATPNVCHCADTLLAFRCGKPVLCEKPMAMNAAECRRMIDGARTAKLPLGVAQVYRFTNTFMRLRERVAAGDIGVPLYARAEFCFPGRVHPRSWMYDRAIAGGGALADVGVHCIDALRFVLQDEVTAVEGKIITRPECRGVEAGAAVLLQFTCGALGVVMASSYAPYHTSLEIVGENGILRAQPAMSLEELVRVELWRGGQIIDAERLFSGNAFARMLDTFALALENGRDFPCTGEEGLKNQLIVDAAYAKSKQKPEQPLAPSPQLTAGTKKHRGRHGKHRRHQA